MEIGIVIGSIREGRKGWSVGEWVHGHAVRREDASFKVLDLKAFDVPLLTSNVEPGGGKRVYESPQVREWSAAVDACDAFIFVTPEYNHGVPGAFKNAYDSLGPEWVGKPVAFVSYGGAGGVRAVEHWRPVVANFQQLGVRAQVALSTNTEWADGEFHPHDRHVAELDALLDMLIAATAKLRG